MKNYWPVSNLLFLSKLLEIIVQSRLQTFLDRNGLMPKTQSAYTASTTAPRLSLLRSIMTC